MIFYIGSQIGLGEFEDVDFSISWAEPPVFLSKITVVGNDKIAVVYSGTDELMRVEDFSLINLEPKFLVAVGNDATYPEVFHYARNKGARFCVTFERVSGVSGLMMFKYRTWAHAQESRLVIFGIADAMGKVHYGVYAPLEMTADESGVIVEGSSSTIVEVEL
jgi:hypothetical protein